MIPVTMIQLPDWIRTQIDKKELKASDLNALKAIEKKDANALLEKFKSVLEDKIIDHYMLYPKSGWRCSENQNLVSAYFTEKQPRFLMNMFSRKKEQSMILLLNHTTIVLPVASSPYRDKEYAHPQLISHYAIKENGIIFDVPKKRFTGIHHTYHFLFARTIEAYA